MRRHWLFVVFARSIFIVGPWEWEPPRIENKGGYLSSPYNIYAIYFRIHHTVGVFLVWWLASILFVGVGVVVVVVVVVRGDGDSCSLWKMMMMMESSLNRRWCLSLYCSTVYVRSSFPSSVCCWKEIVVSSACHASLIVRWRWSREWMVDTHPHQTSDIRHQTSAS